MAEDVTIGTEIAGYRLVRVLGRGGMSVVYLAEDTRLGRNVAVKVIAPELAADEGVRDRFLRESNAAASLDDPNVLPIYGAGEAGGVLYIAMRYVDGTDLKALIEREGPLEPERAVSIVSQVASALDAAHDRGLVHRDVKPGNVLLARTRGGEHAYLTDFGLIKRRDRATDLTKTGQFIGTLDYVAPEQVKGGDVDGRADVYSLGCVLYECLTGEPPFVRDAEVATMYAHLEDPPPSVTAKRPELPAGIDAVVAKAMAKEPDDRQASAGDLAREVRAILETTETAAPSTPARSRRALALLIGMAAAVVAISVAVVALTRGGGTPAASPSSPSSSATSPAGTTPPPIDSLIRMSPDDGTMGSVAKGLPQACGTRVRLAVGEGGAWWRSCTHLARVDLESGRLTKVIDVSLGPAGTGGDVMTAARAVWMPSDAGPEDQFRNVPSVARINPATLEPLRPLKFPSEGLVSSLAFGNGRVWAGFRDGVLRGLDPGNGRTRETFTVPGTIDELAVGDGSVWCLDALDRVIRRVDPRTGKVLAEIPVGAVPSDIVGGTQGVWVASLSVGTVLPIDTSTNKAGLPIQVGESPTAMAEGLGAVWVSDQDGYVRRIDAGTRRVTRFRVGSPLAWIAVDARHRDLWVAVGTLRD